MEGHFCWGQPYITPRWGLLAWPFLARLQHLDFPTPWFSQLELRKRQEGSQWTQEDMDSSDVEFSFPSYSPWLASSGRGILPLLELSRVCHQQLCSQGNQGCKTHSDWFIWNRCDWKLFSLISILNTFLELPAVFLIGRKTAIRRKEKWGDWVSEMNWGREWGWIHFS